MFRSYDIYDARVLRSNFASIVNDIFFIGLIWTHSNSTLCEQAEFDLLDEKIQASILRRRAAEEESRRNQQQRNMYFNRAMFHRYQEVAITQWVRDSLYQGLVKIYKLKKSGVKLSLEQKHLFDKVVGPVELVMKRILKQVPIAISAAMSEKQALVVATKAAAASTAINAKQVERLKAIEDKKQKMLLEEKAQLAAEEEQSKAHKKNKKNKKNDVDDTTTVSGGNGLKLDEMSPLELDKAFMHCFDIFATRVTSLYYRSVMMSMTDVKVPTVTRVAYNTSFQIRQALQMADEKMKKSPITALLPIVQFNEKVLVAAAKILSTWPTLEEMCTQLCSSFKMKDKLWAQKAMLCLSTCLIVKYSADEKHRMRGEMLAADMLQAVVRGYLTRCKLRRIWETATKKYEKEYEKYLEDQLAEKYLQEAEAAKVVSEMNERDASKRRIMLKKIGVDWAEAYVHNVTLHGVVIQINMRIGGKLPGKDYFRNKHVSCVARLFEPAEQRVDTNCTEYLRNASNLSAGVATTQPKIGQLEVLIDDKKATETQCVEWGKYGANVIQTSSLYWDSTTKLKKSKLINVFDTHDDGRELDIATCFLTLSDMNFNSCYNVKVVVNPAYNPEYSFAEDEINPAIAVLEFITSACPPRPPHMNTPDIIHFDHATEVTNDHKRLEEVPLVMSDEEEEEDCQMVEYDVKVNDGMSVVDRLERYKEQQMERKQAEFATKTPLKGQR